MINIVIFSGGTGSIPLQKGLHEVYGSAIKMDIILSAYDNGKSTGTCRRVFGNAILGPSDLRKNQLTRLSLLYNLDNLPDNNKIKLLYNLFDTRFSCIGWESAYAFVRGKLTEALSQMQNKLLNIDSLQKEYELLGTLLDHFFFVRPGIPRSEVLEADFSDFNIANIFYASAAALYGNGSLAEAGRVMGQILELPDCVHLISDVNLFLHAVTQNGQVITDEGAIVDWNNADDPIVDVKLLTSQGEEYVPTMDEGNSIIDECRKIINEADIIIFSAGTQWSSLIPTYLHKGLRGSLKSSRARKFLVMNNVEDKDMRGISADDILRTVSRFIDLEDVTVLLNSNASQRLCVVKDFPVRTKTRELGVAGSSRHEPKRLAHAIMQDYFDDYLQSEYYLFDFDGTIWTDRLNVTDRLEISQQNLMLTGRYFGHKCSIISGNSLHHFEKAASFYSSDAQLPPLDVYCNGGNTHCKLADGKCNPFGHICHRYDLNDDFILMRDRLLTALKAQGFGLSINNFENRGNCILSIKPIANRADAKRIIECELAALFPENPLKYTAHINGNTTIDIMNSEYDKRNCANHILSSHGLKAQDVVYIGDKCDSGNDACLSGLGFRMLKVRDILDFYCFVKTFELNETLL